MPQLEKYSIGVGDRFAHQARAQLQACLLADAAGVEVIPVWNKSNREHVIIGSEPCSVRRGSRMPPCASRACQTGVRAGRGRTTSTRIT